MSYGSISNRIMLIGCNIYYHIIYYIFNLSHRLHYPIDYSSVISFGDVWGARIWKKKNYLPIVDWSGKFEEGQFFEIILTPPLLIKRYSSNFGNPNTKFHFPHTGIWNMKSKWHFVFFGLLDISKIKTWWMYYRVFKYGQYDEGRFFEIQRKSTWIKPNSKVT